MNEQLARQTEKRTSTSTERYLWKDGVRRVERPMDFYLKEMLDKLRDNQVVIVQAETGVGKTSRIPQAILDAHPSERIYMTQPRRDSTRMNAGFIAEEMGVRLGGDKIDYSLKDVKTANPDARIELMVDQSLVNRIIRDKKLPDGVLIIDEAHERSLEIDKLLILIHHYLPNSPNTKIVITSATIDTQKFAKYFTYSDSQEFADIPPESLPTVAKPLIAFNETLEEIDDREYHLAKGEHHTDAAHSVAVSIFAKFLLGKNIPEDKKKVLRTVAKIGGETKAELDAFEHLTIPALREDKLLGNNDRVKVEQGTVLVFLPGKADIEAGIDKIVEFAKVHGLTDYLDALPMYRHLALSEKKKIEEPVKEGTLRVIFTTEILKSSITAPETVGVVDSFQVKRDIADERGISRLTKISQSGAESDQARGRTGRTTSGFYIPILGRGEGARRSSSHPDYWPVPEILRGGIISVILELAAAEIDIRTATLIDRPRDEIIEAAIERLVGIGALTQDVTITPFGKELLKFPLSPEEAKSLFVAAEHNVVPETAKVLAALKEEGLTWFPGRNQTDIVFSEHQLLTFIRDLITAEVTSRISFSFKLSAENTADLLSKGNSELQRLNLDEYYTFSEGALEEIEYPISGYDLVKVLLESLELQSTSVESLVSLYYTKQAALQVRTAVGSVVRGYGSYDEDQVRTWIAEVQTKVSIDRTAEGLSPVKVQLDEAFFTQNEFPMEVYKIQHVLESELRIDFEGLISEIGEYGVSEDAGYYVVQSAYRDVSNRQKANPLFVALCRQYDIFGGSGAEPHIFARNLAFWRWKQFAQLGEEDGKVQYSQSDYFAVVTAYDSYIAQEERISEEYSQKNKPVFYALRNWCKQQGYVDPQEMLKRVKKWEKEKGKNARKPQDLFLFDQKRMELRRKHGLIGKDKSTHTRVLLNKWCDAHSLSARSLARMQNTVTDLMREVRRSAKLQQHADSTLFREFDVSGLTKAILAGLIDNVSLGSGGGPKASNLLVGSDSVMSSSRTTYVFGGIRGDHRADQKKNPRYYTSLCAPINLDWLEEVSPQVCDRKREGSYKVVDGQIFSDFQHTYLGMKYATKEHQITPENVPEAVATLLLLGAVEVHPLTDIEKAKRAEIKDVLLRANPTDPLELSDALKKWYIQQFAGCTSLSECLERDITLTEQHISEIIGQPYPELKERVDREFPKKIQIQGISFPVEYYRKSQYFEAHADIHLPPSVCTKITATDIPVFRGFDTVIFPSEDGYSHIKLQTSTNPSSDEIVHFKEKIENYRKKVAWEQKVRELNIQKHWGGYISFDYLPSSDGREPVVEVSVDGPLEVDFDDIVWDPETNEKIHFYLVDKSIAEVEKTHRISWYIACTNDAELARTKQAEALQTHQRFKEKFDKKAQEKDQAEALDLEVVLLLGTIEALFEKVKQQSTHISTSLEDDLYNAQASVLTGEEHMRQQRFVDARLVYQRAKEQLLQLEVRLSEIESTSLDPESVSKIKEHIANQAIHEGVFTGYELSNGGALIYYKTQPGSTWELFVLDTETGEFLPLPTFNGSRSFRWIGSTSEITAMMRDYGRHVAIQKSIFTEGTTLAEGLQNSTEIGASVSVPDAERVASSTIQPLLYFEKNYTTWMVGAQQMEDGTFRPVMKPKQAAESEWEPYKGFKSKQELGRSESSPAGIIGNFMAYADYLQVERINHAPKPVPSIRIQRREAARTEDFADLEVHGFYETREKPQSELLKIVREGYGNQQVMNTKEWRFAFARLAISGENNSGLYSLIQLPFDKDKIQSELTHFSKTMKLTFNALERTQIPDDMQNTIKQLQAEYLAIEEAFSLLLPIRTIWRSPTLQRLLDEWIGDDDLENKVGMFSALYNSLLMAESTDWDQKAIEKWFMSVL